MDGEEIVIKWKVVTGLLMVAGFVGLSACSTVEEREPEPAGEPSSYYHVPGAGQQPKITDRIASLGQPRKRVVVLNFWNDTPVGFPGLGEFAADELRRGLSLTQRVIVPTDIRLKFQTSDFVQGKKINVSQLVREGRRLGVAVVVLGRISRIALRQRGDEIGLFRQTQSLAGVELELKMFDINAGREIMADTRSGEASSNSMAAIQSQDINSPEYRSELAKFALRDGVTQLIGSVIKSVEKMEWEGRVAKIIGNKVYLNSGRGSGLVVGDILRVLTSGDDVYDPETGAFLGRTQGQLKGTLEVTDFLGEDASIGNVHTGGHFKEGDIVRLY